MRTLTIEHGGPDEGPPIRSDFSTNAHPLGPNPFVLAQIRRADRTRYPDPGYRAVRQLLAEHHEVALERVVVGGSASELIWRLVLAWRLAGGERMSAARTSFGEYRRAGHTLGLTVLDETRAGALKFCCVPDNPTGRWPVAAPAEGTLNPSLSPQVLDLAYHPFHALLSEDPASVLKPLPRGGSSSTAVPPDEVIQLWSPNKLHAVTGVRAAYLVLPRADATHPALSAEALTALAPSWVLSAEGVALLSAHTRRTARNFLIESAARLRSQKERCERLLEDAGWEREPSPLHYGLYRPPVALERQDLWHAALRAQGVKLRNAESFARPGWVRLAARPAAEVTRLIALTHAFRRSG